MTQYRDLYLKDFLDKFGSFKETVGDLELVQSQIDVEKIADIMNFSVDYRSDENVSGSYNQENRTIIIDNNEPEYRQRFTLAHELGHAVNHHPGTQYREKLVNQGPFKAGVFRGLETVANQFAAELLMPRKLVIEVLDDAIQANSIDGTGFDQQSYDQIIQDSAKQLKVSESALRYRVKNLRLIGRA